ncbi:hypothetical protein AB0M80_21285 [Amycolatopsis sp. NPDC051045]|uniref:hypothetical protein n=1 Tax=Amycolatopsis sp. NPDC051045 TaxID=3156922 RepID=UPI0034237AF3
MGFSTGRRTCVGLDLAAKPDMTSWSLLVPDELGGKSSMMWWLWLPESAVTRHLSGRIGKMGGSLRAEDTPGDGLTVVVSLPVA